MKTLLALTLIFLVLLTACTTEQPTQEEPQEESFEDAVADFEDELAMDELEELDEEFNFEF